MIFNIITSLTLHCCGLNQPVQTCLGHGDSVINSLTYVALSGRFLFMSHILFRPNWDTISPKIPVDRDWIVPFKFNPDR